jgi:hypothetical protein
VSAKYFAGIEKLFFHRRKIFSEIKLNNVSVPEKYFADAGFFQERKIIFLGVG